MDKYEYKLKAEQIRKLVKEENYVSAMKIANTIDWRRVKNVAMLCLVSDVYERNEKYEDSHEILLMAYDRSPIGRLIVYKLTELAVKMKDFQDAQDYYREFSEISPNDSSADILKYKINKGKGAGAEELIPILEAFKEKEYHEEWAYELAGLYHQAGNVTKCIEECDQIFLWFRDGKFVEKALELKMLYQPLSEEQRNRYDHKNDSKEPIIKEDQEESEDNNLVMMTEDMFQDTKEKEAMDIQIQPVNVGKFDTINLQAELAKSMEQIMSATEKETVDFTMENIRRLVEESQIIELKFEEETEANEIPLEEAEEAGKSKEGGQSVQDIDVFKKVLAEESDGQISLCMPDANIVEEQITGQICIDDVLREWEKMKQVAEEAIHDAEQKRLNETKDRALQKAETIMTKLAYIIPHTKEEEEIQAQVAAAREEDYLFETAPAFLKEEQECVLEEALSLKEDDQENELTEEENTLNSESDVEPIGDEGIEEIADTTPEVIEETVENELEKTDQPSEQAEEETQEEVREADVIEAGMTAEITQGIEDIIAKEMEVAEADLDPKNRVLNPDNPYILTKEQKDIFQTFLHVRGVHKQISRMFAPINEAVEHEQPFSPGYIAVIGKKGAGKTTLGLAIAKAIQMAQGKRNGKLAKISGEAFNRKDIKTMVQKMSGGFLLIEQAGDLTKNSIEQFMEASRELTESLLLIVEDEKSGMDHLLHMDKDFSSNFTAIIQLPTYNNNELVAFGIAYAKSLTYVIDDMAVLAFYTGISQLMTEEHTVNIEKVKEIIDSVIKRAKRRHIRNLVQKMMRKHYDDDHFTILYEADFDAIFNGLWEE